MKKWLILLAFLPSVVLAGGPKYSYPMVRGMDDEMQNIYHDIANPKINSGTASSMTITNLTVSNLIGGSGRFLQIVSSQTTTYKVSVSASFVDTYLGATITPSTSTSKIIAIAVGSLGNNSSGVSSAYAQILRGVTTVSDSVLYKLSSLSLYVPITLIGIDSPATTSPTTYTVQIKIDAGTAYWGDGMLTQHLYLIELSQ